MDRIWVIERLLDDGTWHPEEMALSEVGAQRKVDVKRLIYPEETNRVTVYERSSAWTSALQNT